MREVFEKKARNVLGGGGLRNAWLIVALIDRIVISALGEDNPLVVAHDLFQIDLVREDDGWRFSGRIRVEVAFVHLIPDIAYLGAI